MPAVPKPEKRQKSKPHGLNRKTPLKAKTSMKRTSHIKPKKSKRTYDHLQQRGICAICKKELGTENTWWHHIKYRSLGGDESDSNMLEVGDGVPWICDCHDKIHRGEISKMEVAAIRARQGSYLKEGGA